jgi:hypothetical protein
VAAIADLRAALATLSGLDQEILRLVGWEQLTVTEAGAALEHDYQHVLVFDPRTGELLAYEIVDVTPVPTVQLYQLFLDAGRTDSPGPTPSEPGLSLPPPDSTSED